MEVRVRIANPAGNITIFVMSPLERSEYARIAGELLKIETFHAEQVGFIERKADGSQHMQMMGGEFCGNASRSFAYLQGMLSQSPQQELLVSVSGVDKRLRAEIDLQKGTSRIQMPLPMGMEELKIGDWGAYSLVRLEGICHILAEGVKKEERFVREAIREAEKVCDCEAYGVIFLDGLQVTPAVYVRQTDSLIWEGSCGSGSTAAGVYLSRDNKEGTYTYELQQPAGVLEVCVQKSAGEVTQCQMGGSVTISEEIKIQMAES